MIEKRFDNPGVLVFLACMLSFLILSAFATAHACVESTPVAFDQNRMLDSTDSFVDVSELDVFAVQATSRASVTDSVLAHAAQVYQAKLAEGQPSDQAKAILKETLTQFGVDEFMASALLRRIESGKIQAPAPVVLSVLQAMAK